MTGWKSQTLADAYYKIGELQRELAQPVDSTINGMIKDLMDQIEAVDCELENLA